MIINPQNPSAFDGLVRSQPVETYVHVQDIASAYNHIGVFF